MNSFARHVRRGNIMALGWQLAVGGAVTLVPSAVHAQSRTWWPGRWTEISRFEDANGLRLTNPQRLTLCGNQLIVLDLRPARVTAFDRNGRFIWTYNHQGSGPGELQSVGSTNCDAIGRVWVPDRANGKVLVLRVDGTLEREETVAESIRRLAPIGRGDGWYSINPAAPATISSVFDSTGVVTRTVAAPIALRQLNLSQRESYVVATPDGGGVVAFRWASVLYKMVPGADAEILSAGVETVAFPEVVHYKTSAGGATMTRIAPSATPGVDWLFTSGDTVFTVFGGRTKDRGRIVDAYASSSGKYLGSTLMPVPAQSVAMMGNTMYLLLLDPIPAIVRYERRP